MPQLSTWWARAAAGLALLVGVAVGTVALATSGSSPGSRVPAIDLRDDADDRTAPSPTPAASPSRPPTVPVTSPSVAATTPQPPPPDSDPPPVVRSPPTSATIEQPARVVRPEPLPVTPRGDDTDDDGGDDDGGDDDRDDGGDDDAEDGSSDDDGSDDD